MMNDLSFLLKFTETLVHEKKAERGMEMALDLLKERNDFHSIAILSASDAPFPPIVRTGEEGDGAWTYLPENVDIPHPIHNGLWEISLPMGHRYVFSVRKKGPFSPEEMDWGRLLSHILFLYVQAPAKNEEKSKSSEEIGRASCRERV